MKKYLAFFSVIFLLLISSKTTFANEDRVPFSVQPVLPDNQISADVSYFDIEMTPDQRQNLEMVIYNSSDEIIEVEISNNFAATNSNGIITYDGSIEDYDETMDYPFDEISEVSQNTIEIDPGEQETVIINVNAPKESFDGTILGGIYVTQEVDEEDGGSGVDIINQYAYAVAVQITEQGNDTEIEPELELNDVTPGIINHRTGIQTEFSNKTPVIVNDLSIVGEVLSADSEELLFTREENFNIAPNNLFNFPVMFDNQPLEPGDYIFRAAASNEDNTFEFEQEFEITEEVADETNESAVELEEEDNNDLLIAILIGVGAIVVLLLITIIFLMLRKK